MQTSAPRGNGKFGKERKGVLRSLKTRASTHNKLSTVRSVSNKKLEVNRAQTVAQKSQQGFLSELPKPVILSGYPKILSLKLYAASSKA